MTHTRGSNQPNLECRIVSRTNDLVSPVKEQGEGKRNRGGTGVAENDVRNIQAKHIFLVFPF